MELAVALVIFLVGIIAGAMLVWFVSRGQNVEKASRLLESQEQVQKKDAEIKALLETNSDLRAALVEHKTQTEQMKKFGEERLEELRQAQGRLSETFKMLSSEALQKNVESFMQTAKLTFEQWQSSSKEDLLQRQQSISDVVKPLKESLEKIDGQVRNLEKSREGAYQSLHEQVKAMHEVNTQLRQETQTLSRALHAPTMRGRWGEIQLRRIVELSGMVAHCDFEEQRHGQGEDQALRPDLIVKLPNKKCVVVDAKTPLHAFLKAAEAQSEGDKAQYLKDHADLIRRHMSQLSKKNYWKHFDASPEFVVLFLPGEVYFSAALTQDPSLIEIGIEQGVVIATPTTLIALLRTVAYGWTEQALADNAMKISKQAHKLYERLAKLSEHFHKLGKSLGNTVDVYNQTVGSFESRVLSSAQKLKTLGGYSGELENAIDVIEKVPKMPREIEVEMAEFPLEQDD